MISRSDAEAFLFLEARLMDGHAYDEWLALWADDAHYWVPCNDDDYDHGLHVSIVNEDRTMIEDRIMRLKSGQAHAQDPKSRMCRVVGNIEHRPVGEDECEVLSAFNLTVARHGKIGIVAGRNTHRLRATASGLRIVSKKVVLVDNDEEMHNLTFLI